MNIQYAKTTSLSNQIIDDLATSDVRIVMRDRNMHLDDSEREILVYGIKTNVLDTGFGDISDVSCWFKAWSGAVIVDDVYLPRDQAKAVLKALGEKIQGVKIEKASELLTELAILKNQCDQDLHCQKDPLHRIFDRGSVISIDNHYGKAPKKLQAPIFLRLDCQDAFATGLQGLYGFYNDRADRVVVTDRAEREGGTFFIVSENRGNLSPYSAGKVQIYMRSPRTLLPGMFPELERTCFATEQTGEVAGQVHSMLKRALESQMRKVSSSN